MNKQYSYKSFFGKKENRICIENDILIYNGNRCFISEIRKIIIYYSPRPSIEICFCSGNLKVNAASFDDKGKPITQLEEFIKFFKCLVEKLDNSVTIQKSIWLYYVLQFVSSTILTLASTYMLIITYTVFQELGLVWKFYFHLIYGTLPLIFAVVGFTTLKKPTRLSKESVLELINTTHRL